MTDTATPTADPVRELSPLDAAFAEYREQVRGELYEEMAAAVTTGAVVELDAWLNELRSGANLLDKDSMIDRVLDVRNRLAHPTPAVDTGAPIG